MSTKEPSPTAPFYPQLLNYLNQQSRSFDSILDSRKRDLEQLASYIRSQIVKGEPAKLIFICTHNSRRSHLSQIWAQVAADYYGVQGVETYSGGTEATAFNPRAVAALQRSGFKISAEDPHSSNPKYFVGASDASEPLVCFSKIYDARPNPSERYGAVMTCAHADEACPVVRGCDLRIPLRYDDPKEADGTEFESQRYDERAAQICREMLYALSIV